MSRPESPFFDIPRTEWIASNRSAFAVWDAFPVSPGHALVISRRQIGDWWRATTEEKVDLLELIDEVRVAIVTNHSPDGFNVGFNAGTAAGQTIDHLHIHVIPRYLGDMPDPRGGVRHVIPGRGNYLDRSAADDAGLSPTDPVLIDGQVRLLLPELVEHLRRTMFDRVDIVVSFIKMSGLKYLLGALLDALDRGARVRVLTTDYLGLTEPLALARLHDLMDDHPGQLTVRVFHDPEVSFHPKAYLFYSSTEDQAGSAFVGSSNLSGSGLAGGIEWNLLVGSIAELQHHFSTLWSDERCKALTETFISEYRAAPPYVPEVVEVVDAPEEPPRPRPIQTEALQALAQTREAGFRAGMVTLATGLGKTWLAAFDVAAAGCRRILFIAHREEILRQSRDVFRQIIPKASLGLYYGGEKQGDADIVFASVQTLSRNLELFAPDAFDYIVVDEFHHAAAATYRAALDHFSPQFLLGLTATPERMDGADLLSLCADNQVFDCGLVEGIRRGELVPFRYWGVPDPVDFEPIPWRNGKFDLILLEAAVETQERAQASFDEWQARRGERTLAFCVSTHHADFMCEFFASHGIRCASVHSAPTSAPRNESIDALREGDLEVVFAVDLFNEGLDVPTIDTVLMLRPTESPIVFLQQLGRGLRTVEGKHELIVVDFIGNHRSFLLRPRTLLSLSRQEAPTTLQVLQAMAEGDFELPEGCSVDYQLEVVDVLRRLTRMTQHDAIEEYCRSYFDEEGLRPTAAQVFRAGHDPSAVVSKHGSWFGFLHAINLLGDRETVTFEANGKELSAIQSESINKCYKLIAMRALLHDGKLCTGDLVSENADTSRSLLLADPRLSREVPSSQFPDLATAPLRTWAAYWRRWPIAHLTGADNSSGRTDFLFRLEADRITPAFTVAAEHREVFAAMAAELIEYRLARYVLNDEWSGPLTWACRLAYSNGAPVVRLDRRKYPNLPSGQAQFVSEGVTYQGNFGPGALAFASRQGGNSNALPDVLRGWFGSSAGHAGTACTVELVKSDNIIVMRPSALHNDRTDIAHLSTVT